MIIKTRSKTDYSYKVTNLVWAIYAVALYKSSYELMIPSDVRIFFSTCLADAKRCGYVQGYEKAKKVYNVPYC